MLDEIVLIEKLDPEETIDIEVSGDHLFYANDILTHNSNSDVSLTDTADSIGLIMSLDMAFAIISTEDLASMNQVIIKMLKNRYGGLDRFVCGLDKPKMSFYQVEDSAQKISKPTLAAVSSAPQRLGQAAANKFEGFKF